ncbi:hypothetical protein GIB67_022775 [Kingdonia uniflora]|uniref:Probable purine permease n=1 Tax=Kingdonia uniflora TaxID=39325 RepID=A0A7J7LZ92_9MAGN|nr:hypothetical protein GIB67_022775 [Kingdonia uniflora]
MPFSRDYSRFVFDPFKDLWFMEQAQYEIDTYGTERRNILKLSSLRNIREKCIHEFQRDVTHKDLRNRWDYLKNKYKIWETLKQLAEGSFTPLFRSCGCKGLVVELVSDRRFPILSLSILLSYFYRRKNNPEGGLQTQLYFLTWRLFVAGSIIGVLLGVDNYLYSSGTGKLPVSTSSLLLSTQLAFTAIFAFIIVKQNFTSYSVNSVVLLIVASLILGLHANSDRPNHESNKTYYAGFFLTLGAAVLYGIILPTIELMYKKANQNVTYYFVMEMQFVISIFATAFSTVGMLVNKDFQGIPKEAREYELGEAKYYLVLVFILIISVSK